MLIDKEKIQEAKEKLGDRNFEIMMDCYNVWEYDKRNMKCSCPFHFPDKTPSFVYNKAKYYGHCFSCGKTVDVIDAFMSTGCTYLEACQKIFELAGIQVPMGEMHVKTKADYRYPYEPPKNERSAVNQYFALRGISEDTLNHCDVREEGGNAAFLYYDTNDVLTLVKYKLPHKPDKTKHEMKSWCQKNASTTPLLFNMNRVNTSMPLLITEGEPDCLAAIECGYTNAVSVPFGAGSNNTWIRENFEWLDQFPAVIIAFDNDEAGVAGTKDALYRLGSWKTKVMLVPETYQKPDGKTVRIKDINEMYYYMGKEAVLDAIVNAKDTPVPSVEQFSDIEEISLSDMDGVETGIRQLDRELLKLFYGTLTVITGRPGAGKSSLVNQILANTMEAGHAAFLFSQEMNNQMLSNWANLTISGNRHIQERSTHDGKTYYIVPKNVKDKIKKWTVDKLYIYKDDQPNDVKSVMKSMEDCVRKYNTKLIILDNLMMLDLECSDDNKNTAQTKLVNDLIQFSKKFNVAVILIAHPRKTQDISTDIGMYDIAGSSTIINLAMRSIGLRRVSKREKQDEKNEFKNFDVILTIIKDRMMGRSDIQIGLHYDIKSRRFFTNYEEYAKDYSWDDTVYEEALPVPECLISPASEVFGTIAGGAV